MDFADWLVEEMRRRDWSQANLAKKTGISRGGISNLINRVRQPSPKTCRAISHAFDMPVDLVLQKAGILPTGNNSDEDPLIRMITHLSSQLDPEDREEIIAFIQTKKRIGEQRGKYGASRHPRPTQP